MFKAVRNMTTQTLLIKMDDLFLHPVKFAPQLIVWSSQSCHTQSTKHGTKHHILHYSTKVLPLRSPGHLLLAAHSLCSSISMMFYMKNQRLRSPFCVEHLQQYNLPGSPTSPLTFSSSFLSFVSTSRCVIIHLGVLKQLWIVIMPSSIAVHVQSLDISEVGDSFMSKCAWVQHFQLTWMHVWCDFSHLHFIHIYSCLITGLHEL